MDQGLTPVELKIMFIMKIIYEYSVHNEHQDYLNKKELRELIEKELPNFLSVRLLPESG